MAAVIYLGQRFPIGYTSGAAQVQLNRLQTLQQLGYEVYFITFHPGPGVQTETVASFCKKLMLIPKQRSGLKKRLVEAGHLLKYGFWPKLRPELWQALRDTIATEKIAMVWLDNLLVAKYGRFLKATGYPGRIVLLEQNFEQQLLIRQQNHTGSWKARHRIQHELTRARRIEQNLAAYCDLCIPLSEADVLGLKKLNPGFPIQAVPTAIDLEYYRRRTTVAPQPAELVFIGGLDWAPNLDGISWFINRVFPTLRQCLPGLHLTVVGTKPPRWLQQLPDPITVTGFVPDERPYLERARVMIAPLRFGSGVKIKILNAMAMKLPVITTPIGAEGIPVRHNESILIAAAAADFISGTERLLQEPGLAARIAAAGHRVCRENYSQPRVAQQLQQIISGRARTEPGRD